MPPSAKALSLRKAMAERGWRRSIADWRFFISNASVCH